MVSLIIDGTPREIRLGENTALAGIYSSAAEASATAAAGSASLARNSVPFATWTALAAATGMSAGDRATVRADDGGTHTDPVAGGTVSNAGNYLYSASPAGWERVADLDSQVAQTATAQLSAIKALTPEQGGGVVFTSDNNREVARIDGNGLRAYKGLFSGQNVTIDDIPAAPLKDRLLGAGLAGFIQPMAPESGYSFAVVSSNNRLLFGVPINAPITANVAYATAAGYATLAGNRTIDCYGDSLTDGLGAVKGTTDYPTVLGSLSGRTVRNRGVSGQTGGQVIARQGGDPALITVSGNQIPASGAVSVTAITQTLVQNYPSGTTQTLTGTLAGVKGTLSFNVDAGTYSFTRTTSGTAIACPAATPFLADLAASDQEDVQVIWVGRNDLSQGIDLIAVTVPKVENAIRWLQHGRFLIIGVTTLMDGTEDAGSSNYTKACAYNNYMAARWGGRFFNVMRYLQTDAFTDAGITPNSTDLTDIAADRIPTRWRRTLGGGDYIHFNEQAYALIAAKVNSILIAKGF